MSFVTPRFTLLEEVPVTPKLLNGICVITMFSLLALYTRHHQMITHHDCLWVRVPRFLFRYQEIQPVVHHNWHCLTPRNQCVLTANVSGSRSHCRFNWDPNRYVILFEEVVISPAQVELLESGVFVRNGTDQLQFRSLDEGSTIWFPLLVARAKSFSIVLQKLDCYNSLE